MYIADKTRVDTSCAAVLACDGSFFVQQVCYNLPPVLHHCRICRLARGEVQLVQLVHHACATPVCYACAVAESLSRVVPVFYRCEGAAAAEFLIASDSVPDAASYHLSLWSYHISYLDAAV